MKKNKNEETPKDKKGYPGVVRVEKYNKTRWKGRLLWGGLKTNLIKLQVIKREN